MPRIRKPPVRPERRAEHFVNILNYGRKCTAEAAWAEKNAAGLFDALFAAKRDTGQLPPWAIDGLIAYMRQTMRQFVVGRGRTTRFIERHRQDRVDFARYDVVQTLHFNYGLKWDDAFSMAVRHLRGLAGGSRSTIEGSYKRVSKHVRSGQWGRYFQSPYLLMRGLDDQPFDWAKAGRDHRKATVR
jgi:hypothetical protein